LTASHSSLPSQIYTQDFCKIAGHISSCQICCSLPIISYWSIWLLWGNAVEDLAICSSPVTRDALRGFATGQDQSRPRNSALPLSIWEWPTSSKAHKNCRNITYNKLNKLTFSLFNTLEYSSVSAQTWEARERNLLLNNLEENTLDKPPSWPCREDSNCSDMKLPTFTAN
jgi:hypothetical protein